MNKIKEIIINILIFCIPLVEFVALLIGTRDENGYSEFSRLAAVLLGFGLIRLLVNSIFKRIENIKNNK